MHKDREFRFPINYVLMFKALLLLWIITALYIGPVQARDYLLDDGIEEIKNQISKQIKTMGVKSLAILDFTDISGKDDLFGRYLSEKLIIALFNLEGITVVERSKLNQVLSEHERQQVGLIDPKTTKKIGQFLGIDALLIGTVTDMGGSLEVIGRLVHTETARIQAVTSLSFVKDGKTEMLYRQGQGTPVGQIAPVRIIPGGFMDPFTSMVFVFVKGGCFFMGDTFDEGDRDEKPVHEVCVNDFYMGKYEVTQGQWEKIMGNNPSRFSYGIHYPVEEVGWNDALAFIEKLNITSRRHYRLPTEAEWEFAARSGGKKEKYAGIGTEENLGDYAIFKVNAGASTRPVGTKKPNTLGIHDMSGNVWEWCQDWYDEDYYRKSPKLNPTGSNDKRVYRVLRGGAWNYPANQLRAANRSRSKPSDRFQDGNGFRLVLPIQ